MYVLLGQCCPACGGHLEHGRIVVECRKHDNVYCTGGRLHQTAAPELAALQQEPSWSASEVPVSSEKAVEVQHVSGPSWFARFTLQRGDASASGLLLRSWLHQDPDGSQACAAALLLNWKESQLQVPYPHTIEC